MSNHALHVVKLGGSLLDLPDLREKVMLWLHEQSPARFLFVVGGGQAADHVRTMDSQFTLGPDVGHRLAVEAMRFNAMLVYPILPGATWTVDPDRFASDEQPHGLGVLDPVAWLDAHEKKTGDFVPRRWSFTSDSIAALVARSVVAARLTLLKSTLPSASTFAAACEQGVVDSDFAQASAGVPHVELVNLRTRPPGRCVLRSSL
ncbi:MAG: hypothetical protein GC164_08475 [Phycisphaera sp.]|nr:hypothetical protein [Phycisphaera sp.]